MPTGRKVLIYSFSEPNDNEHGGIEDTSLSSPKRNKPFIINNFNTPDFFDAIYPAFLALSFIKLY